MIVTRNFLRNLLAERRIYQRGSLDHEWRTRAARKLIWIMRGVPAAEWMEAENAH